MPKKEKGIFCSACVCIDAVTHPASHLKGRFSGTQTKQDVELVTQVHLSERLVICGIRLHSSVRIHVLVQRYFTCNEVRSRKRLL